MTRRDSVNMSGFSSDVPETGREVKPVSSSTWDTSSQITLTTTSEPVTVFHETELVAVGGYIRPAEPITVSIQIGETEKTFSLQKELWNPIGAHATHDSSPVTATISTDDDTFCETVGLTAAPLEEDIFVDGITYSDGKTVRDVFETRTYGCVPYIYYLSHEVTRTGDGSTVLYKSCNRCGRYLPVEKKPERERRSASFSNHSRMSEITCVEGTYAGESTELKHGYQLECKACKKFYVNAALNHKRSTAQRREDSLRRREVEELVEQYADVSNIYKTFRQENGVELDEHILSKFDNECFKCGKHLESTADMHLDHTMPLSYLWPLDETATALCPMCNSAKSDSFPVEFYTDSELESLSDITGLPMETITMTSCNPDVVKSLPPIESMDVSESTKESLRSRLE